MEEKPMKTTKKSTLTFQIIRGYFLVALLGITMIMSSVFYFVSIQRKLVKIENDRILPTIVLSEQLLLIEAQETDLYKMLVGSRDECVLYYELFKEKDRQIKESITSYEQGISDESLSQFKEAYYQYRNTIENIYHISIANDLEEARTQLMSKAFKDWKKSMVEDLKIYLDSTQAKATVLIQEEVSKGETLRRIISIVTVIWLGLAIALPIYIGKRVGKALNQMKWMVEEISSGDFTTYQEIKTSSSEVEGLQKALETMCFKIENVFQEVRSATYQVSEGAEQISGASTMLATGATEQAGAIDELNVAIEEIAAHTKENDKSIQQIHQLSVAMSMKAKEGNLKMQDTLEAMAQVDTASDEIAKINKVVEEIAFQTNMLALNAAVEAARAGQNGLGFAVVAEEVRKLAAKSAQAAKETNTIIEGSLSKLEQGMILLQETAEVFEHITKSTQKENDLIHNIMGEIRSESDHIEAICQTAGQLAEVVQSNSAASEETAAASIEFAKQSDRLKVKLSQFKLKDE